ncbi:hypothetical protein H2201_002736 [Coniosporium apollinis]|uniref:RGS domain-containing protein n=1 Tax=Coniosporium apollinis TaxID=61459 RepID=A0ABQ9NXV3_9PEZI|nr:hypothetical protein H2201_002736 [Coniosporium apollinis]
MANFLVERELDFGKPNLDGVGIFYITFAIVWTLIVSVGLWLLWRNRRNAAIRIRSFTLTAAAVFALHVYFLCVVTVYPENGLFKCGSEFWVMSIWLPFGIGLFQAANMRLLAYYEAQECLMLAEAHNRGKKRHQHTQRNTYEIWKSFDKLQRTYALIGLGLLVTVVSTFIMFFGSPKCRRGYEWLPGIIWQLLYSTVFGPYILLKTRHIHDTHYWAWQTRVAVISGAPATPLWVAFTYSDGPFVKEFTRWVPAAGWFIPCLLVMQSSLIFFPLLDARKGQKYNRRMSDRYSTETRKLTMPDNHKNRDLYSMAALEVQIAKNIEPLLRWSARKEFTAENIVFLKTVRDFKRKWQMATKKGPLDNEQSQEQYAEAALIYFTLVHPSTAMFNINIDSRTYNDLAAVFADVQYEPLLEASSPKSDNVVTPWNDGLFSSQSDEHNLLNDVDRKYPMPVTEITLSEMGTSSASTAGTADTSALKIPIGFSVDVFDRAYESVKYLVFTNTWTRFIDAADASSVADSESSAYTSSSSGPKSHFSMGN